MKRFIYIICMINIILLCSCVGIVPGDDENTDFSQLGGVASSFSCVQFHNQLLYLTNEIDRFYILSEDGGCTYHTIPGDLETVELTASNSYIYLYCMDMNTDIYNGILLVYDENMELIKSLRLPFDRIFAKNDTIYAYRGGETRTFFHPISNISNPYIECNYYMKESDFLKYDNMELQDWEEFVLDDKIEMDELTLYRHNPNPYHERAFYSNVVEMPMFEYEFAWYIHYFDGRFSSGESERHVIDAVEELYGLMKEEEPNFYVWSFEHGDILYGVCNVYERSAYLTLFNTKDIDYSFVFSYDNQNMKKVLEVEDVELVYSDGIHLLSHRKDGIYLSDMNLENQEKVFDWDGEVSVTVLDGIVMVEKYNRFMDGPLIEIKKLW